MLGYHHHHLEELFCCGNVAFRAEHELNGLPRLIHHAIQIFTCLPDFDLCLINTIGRAAHLQMLADAFVDLRRISLDPAKDG